MQVFREVVYFAPGVRRGGELERLAFPRRTHLVPQRLGFSGSHGGQRGDDGGRKEGLPGKEVSRAVSPAQGSIQTQRWNWSACLHARPHLEPPWGLWTLGWSLLSTPQRSLDAVLRALPLSLSLLSKPSSSLKAQLKGCLPQEACMLFSRLKIAQLPTRLAALCVPLSSFYQTYLYLCPVSSLSSGNNCLLN